LFIFEQFLEGKDLELHATRQVGLLDFIASALPASHTSRPVACQVTVYLLRLLRVLLSLPANRTYFLVQNLLPPIIPMLSASLENYIKVAASNSGSLNLPSSKTSSENMEIVGEVLDGFLWTVTVIVGHLYVDDEQLHMQEGLIELIVAYQTIHRLRDLFALYDRPQVEGSPLPSSILFGLNLLTVLTSKPGNFSTIDWESCKCRIPAGNLAHECEYLSSLDIRFGNQLIVSDESGDAKLPSTSCDISKCDGCGFSELVEEKKSADQPECCALRDRRSLDEARKGLLGPSAGPNNSSSALEIQSSNLGDTIHQHSEVSTQRDETSTVDGHLEGRKMNNICIGTNGSPGKGNEINLKQSAVLVLSAMAETGLVSLPSLLTAVLLQANNRSSSDQVCVSACLRCNAFLRIVVFSLFYLQTQLVFIP
jgi:hypothetical protein